MPRPFQLPVNIGTDICSVLRILRIAKTIHFERFAQKILTPTEWSLHQEKLIHPARAYQNISKPRRSNPEEYLNFKTIEDTAHKAASFLAGRFAAKEAIMKANHHRRLTYHDIEIATITKPLSYSAGSLPPIAIIRSNQGSWENGQEVPISISHDGHFATATSLAFSGLDPDGLCPDMSTSQPYNRDLTTKGATTLPQRQEVVDTQVQGKWGNADGKVVEAADSKVDILVDLLETEEQVGNKKKEPATEG
ncbi:hypothetical protein BJ875DRAFT_156831 [Amylocarpus encephaloides]|uniref:4'-phosphopantetheinyl transferase domain-containing protein n=1 Tax=Amylocarpus encephaloides TaxID=45428 RepID=A0A9P8C8H4_9HELO|nr:hypothetical protein BJ875DRAFT_156831 [Amylocarpus encephaloides]